MSHSQISHFELGPLPTRTDFPPFPKGEHKGDLSAITHLAILAGAPNAFRSPTRSQHGNALCFMLPKVLYYNILIDLALILTS